MFYSTIRSSMLNSEWLKEYEKRKRKKNYGESFSAPLFMLCQFICVYNILAEGNKEKAAPNKIKGETLTLLYTHTLLIIIGKLIKNYA